MHTSVFSPLARGSVALAALALAVAALAGCSAAASAPAASSAATDATAAEAVSTSDLWVKTADEGMTAGFGMLANTGGTDITVVAVSTPASARTELHETVQDETGSMVMQPVEDGFAIPAGGELTFAPAGNHIMMLEVTEPIVAGDEVEFTFEFSDGSELDVTAVAKDYSGANETYVEEGGEMDMGDDEMDMGGDQ